MCGLRRRKEDLIPTAKKKKSASFCITYCRFKFIVGTDFEEPMVSQDGGREHPLGSFLSSLICLVGGHLI